MTTATINFDAIREMVQEMIKMGVSEILPSQSNGVFYNEEIQELLVDEEGTVFILFKNDLDNPLMIPMFVDVA